jgi:uncharacterized protein (DUF4415 family)
MNEKNNALDEAWVDPDDAPEWKEEHFESAQISIGGVVIREATGTYMKPGRPRSPTPKKQVTLRLDELVIKGFRATGPGWQSRINAELRKALKLDG